MKRDYKLYLNDIKESIEQIENYLRNISQEEFNKNKLLQDGIIRRLEIIGEASRNIPRALKEKNKQVPWFDLAQFRDLVSHAYYAMSLDRIWKEVKEKIPKLKELLKTIKFV